MTLFATAVEAWFTSQTSGLVFGVSGALVGTLGGVFGIVGIRRIPRTAGMTILGSFFALSLVCGIVGLFALIVADQPYHVWYPFTLFGAVGMIVIGTAMFAIRRAYQQVERSQLESQLLREKWTNPNQG